MNDSLFPYYMLVTRNTEYCKNRWTPEKWKSTCLNTWYSQLLLSKVKLLSWGRSYVTVLCWFTVKLTVLHVVKICTAFPGKMYLCRYKEISSCRMSNKYHVHILTGPTAMYLPTPPHTTYQCCIIVNDNLDLLYWNVPVFFVTKCLIKLHKIIF